MEIRWAPLLHTRRGLTGRAGGRGGLARAPRGRDAARRRGPADRTLLRSHEPEANLDFVLDLAQAGIPDGPGRLGPGRARRRASRIPSAHRGALEVARDLGPARHAPRRRVGRRGAGPAGAVASSRSGSPTARWPSTTRSSCAELIARQVWLDLCPTSNSRPNIVPTIAAHPLPRLHAGRRAGHAQHGRPDGLRRHAVRGVRPGRRAHRPHAAGAVGREHGRLEAAFCGEPTWSTCARRSSPGAPGSRSCSTGDRR